jgi:hypothetical protein
MSLLVDPRLQLELNARTRAGIEQGIREAPARLAAKEAKAAALERLRAKYPELFSMRPDECEPPPYAGAMYLKPLGVDVSKDGFLEVLLRPHLKSISQNRGGRPEAFKLLRPIVDDVLDKLDIDEEDVNLYIYPARPGYEGGGLPRWTNMSLPPGSDHLRKTIEFLQAAVRLAAPDIGEPLKTRTQKAAERQAKANAERSAKEREETRRVRRNATLAEHGYKPRSGLTYWNEQRERNSAYSGIMMKLHKAAPPSANLLGLHDKPEENLLKFPSVEEELAPLFPSAAASGAGGGAKAPPLGLHPGQLRDLAHLATSLQARNRDRFAAAGGAGGGAKAPERKRSRRSNRKRNTRRRKN